MTNKVTIKDPINRTMTGNHGSDQRATNTSAEECKQFVKEGLCGDRTKTCEDEDECHTQAPDFKEQYEWYNTKVVEYKDCSFTRIRLHTDIYDHNTIINNCKTNDLTCEIDKKRYIWDEIEIPTCPFETIIYNETFSFDKDNGNIIFSERLGIAFEMKNSFKICNTSTVWETTSGLIAEKTSEQRLRKENITVDSYSRMKILEAESDFKSYKNAYINSHERKVDCIQMINTIRTIKNTIDNRVFKITNHKGEPLVFYVRYSQVYLPSCFDSQMISIPKQVEFGTDCADFIKVYERKFNTWMALTQDKVVIPIENIDNTTCINKEKMDFYTDNNKKKFRVYRADAAYQTENNDGSISQGKYEWGVAFGRVYEDNNEKFYDIDKIEEIKPNMNHIITERFMNKLRINNENKNQNRTTYIRLKDISENKWEKLNSITEHVKEEIQDTWNSLSSVLRRYMIIIVAPVVTLLIIILITILTIKLRKKNKEINLMRGFLPVQDQETFEVNNLEEDVTVKMRRELVSKM